MAAKVRSFPDIRVKLDNSPISFLQLPMENHFNYLDQQDFTSAVVNL